MNQSMYSDAQWRWVIERYDEGYSTYVLSDFLDIGQASVYTQLKRRGAALRRAGPPPRDLHLPELDERKREFYALIFA